MKRVKVFLWFLLVCFSLPLMAQETEEQDSLQTEDLDLAECGHALAGWYRTKSLEFASRT